MRAFATYCREENQLRKRFDLIRKRKRQSPPEGRLYVISPRFAKAVMRSAARKDSASMVMVGWPRPEVTRLLPSQRKRFLTSWVRWSELITDVFGSFPMRHVPRRCTANCCSLAGKLHFFCAPAASKIS